MSKRTRVREAEGLADANQSPVDSAVATLEQAGVTDEDLKAAEDESTVPPRWKRPRQVSYQLWGLARSTGEWEYIQDLDTIGQVRRWVVGSQNLARKAYSAVKVIRQKMAGLVDLDFCRPDDESIKKQIN